MHLTQQKPTSNLTWLQEIDAPDVILGYGSLLNHDSRSRFSGIDCPSIPVTVHGFQRGWVTRAHHENQTYVGAWANVDNHINAQIVPVSFDPAFQQRERDYRFVRVGADQVKAVEASIQHSLAAWLTKRRIWICETLLHHEAEADFPVNASYVATCLLGCANTGLEQEAERFMALTSHWPDALHIDLHLPKYPRSAALCETKHDWLHSKFGFVYAQSL